MAGAQTDKSKWQIGANAGFAAYQGDLTPIFLGSYKILKPTLGFTLSRILTPSLKLRTSLSLGQLVGDESIYSKPAFRQQRNLNFHTPFTEISEVIVWNFLDHDDDLNYKKFSPYVLGGIGVNFLNISRSSANTSAAYLATELNAAAGLAQDLQTKPPTVIMVIPVGLGVEYYVSPAVSLNFELNFRYTNTDYLDGFSKVANPKSNDYYYTGGIGILYKFNKKGTLGCPVLSF